MKKLNWLLFIIVLILSACANDSKKQEPVDIPESEQNKSEETSNEENLDSEIEEVVEELSPKEEMIITLSVLIDRGYAYDTGSYIKGDIPEGEYAFIGLNENTSYYSEEDSGNQIVDNENFDSFGYVYVRAVGNITTRGVLVSAAGMEILEIPSAKELYEILNEVENYEESGYYKIGIDIEPGEYIFESEGKGYVAALSGPVGNRNIIQNNNFDGRYALNLEKGQYLKISRAKISK